MTYPQIVLMAMMGYYTASVLLGNYSAVPKNFLNSLCNSLQETKGKGKNTKIVTKGILLRPEYFYTYKFQTYSVGVKDASNSKKTLTRAYFPI